MEPVLFDAAYMGSSPQESLEFIVNSLQSSTEYAIIVEGLDGTILLWNEGARRLYGYEAAEVLGKARSDMLHTPEDIRAGGPCTLMQAALRDGKWEGGPHPHAQERPAVPGACGPDAAL
jgi:PAS domain-containing protein